MKKNYYVLVLVILLTLTAIGCSPKEKKIKDETSSNKGNLIYESTISPNDQYIDSEENKVEYTVSVYQGKNSSIHVNAESNSAFFEQLQYNVKYDKPIDESDVAVKWTTLTGNPEATEEDQIGLATVSISENGEVISERKINFVNKAIEIVVDTIENSQ